ncbi:DUF1501 domain-containing protein [Lignipirellula cremea]|uniref:Sulfatase n=1 Tax=Lignipirellula cremea TaxID=2528010 RepID=A0A518DZX0_9BACT|nr:DUF1501 domain-containing protein [Lignipirellula cremea]QDU97386.1 hypothetical protein Pla8534_52320 [Lignipirellula cremea]
MTQFLRLPQTRRGWMATASAGAASLALATLAADDAAAAPGLFAPKGTHFEPRAKRVIWLFMHGGPSHVDLFDPKPDLLKYAGQPLPESFGAVDTRRNVARNALLAPVAPFRKSGSSGLPLTEMMPHLAEMADELCMIRSLHGDSVNHPQSVYQMNTGSILMGRPAFGSWLAYGMGSENQNLPAFVVLPDPGGGVKGGPPAWGNGFLPAAYQGTPMRPKAPALLHLKPPGSLSRDRQRATLDLVQAINRDHLQQRNDDDELAARIEAYELAFRMQTAAPELVDLSGETAETLSLYGVDQSATQEFGARCLLARRMIERGVRCVQLYSGDTNGWDAHNDVRKNHQTYCERTDKPVAGLLLDLKRRGLLEDTLVIWGGEFGRMPMSEQGTGRDHNPWGYSVWLAGGGVKRGFAYGATDAVGLRATEQKVSVRDFHATLLHLLGMDHNRLTYEHNGLDQRLTGPDEAHPVKDLLA